MLLFNRLYVVFLFFSLTGCGFQPLYESAPLRETSPLSSIKIAQIGDRKGQILRNYLQDTFTPYGEPTRPLYRLEVKLTISEDAFAFRKDATASRQVMTSTALYNLVDVTSKKIVYSDSAEATTSFGIGDHSDQATFPAITSLKKETERAMNLLAQEIRLQIATFLASPKSVP
ncbi:hypothetical protein Cva_00018 [Caedimonas varicaedens]|uniref:LPS-assembly lipoprotein LptE n=1 Tax=Caedimonas varicaedens TaxID=1629334 RepID=A0A0K8MAC4_9PROT|nr:hypothetical protein Cva_00018 [Caedimonas varicaedens]